MPTLFGRQWTPEQLRQFTGHMNQLAGVRAITYDDGRSKGLRAFEVWTGTGLAFHVLAGRSLDVGPCTFNGKSLTWNSPAGFAHPPITSRKGCAGCARSAAACSPRAGSTSSRPPRRRAARSSGCTAGWRNLPAEQVGYRTYWDGDEYRLEMTGVVRQARLFGENLLLRRRIIDGAWVIRHPNRGRSDAMRVGIASRTCSCTTSTWVSR